MYNVSYLGCSIIQLPELLLVFYSNIKKICFPTYKKNTNASNVPLFTVKEVNDRPNKQVIIVIEEVNSIIDEKILDVKAELEKLKAKLDLTDEARANVTYQDIQFENLIPHQ